MDENRTITRRLEEKITENQKLRETNQKQLVELHQLRGIDHELKLLEHISQVRLQEVEKWRCKHNIKATQLEKLKHEQHALSEN